MSGFTPKFTDELPQDVVSWRRVVTGTRDGRSIIAIDQQASPFQMGVEGALGIVATDMWRTPANPSCNPEGGDSCSLPLVCGPPPGGTVAQILEWPTDKTLFGTDDPSVARNVTAHATSTIDYLLVISGEIWVTMDEGETLLRPGDTLVQRGTNHGWSNRGTEPCRMFVVMIDAS